jgi:outer membrane protein assembly factor BamA
MRLAIIALLSLLFCKSLFAQQEERKNFKIIPFPALGYSPETRWYIGGVVLCNVHFYNDTVTRLSTFKPELNFTQNKQRILTFNYTFFTENNRIVLLGQNSFSKFPENYWGIGNLTPESNLQSYEANRMELDNNLLFRIKPYVYLGTRYRYENIYNVHSVSKKNQTVANEIKGGISSGLGFILQYDSRDNILNPLKGSLYNFSNLYFDKKIGSDFAFARYELDVRKYYTIFKRTILAFQGLGVFNTGHPPFRMFALLGSDSHMRGYYQGRFRDKHYLTAQAELRTPIWKIFGSAFFIGTGEVFNRSFALDGLKPSYGAGLRIRVDKENNVNLRFDYAIGEHTNGFYVAFGEAF